MEVDPDYQIQSHRTAKILNVEYIIDTILDAVSPLDILYFALTCRLARRTVIRYRSFVFNINRRLRRFFRDPLVFRSLQAQTHTLISGSFALQFFDRSEYADSDLDLYTHPGYSRLVGKLLIDEGYEFQPTPEQDASFDVAERTNWRGTQAPYGAQDNPEWDGYQWNGVWEVYSFEKKDGEESLKAQVIASSMSPLESILNFHSTVVHNFISYSHAHSLYPKATFVYRQALCLERATQQYEAALTKYRARGWDIQERSTDCTANFAMDVDRHVNDQMSWVISLDLDGVQAPESCQGTRKFQDDPVALNSFRLSSSHRTPRRLIQFRLKGPINVMLYEMLVHPLLRYQYLIVDSAFLAFCETMLSKVWDMVKGTLTFLPVDVREKRWPWLDCQMHEFRQAYVSKTRGDCTRISTTPT